ncbi:MAG: dipeptide epimerase [Lachnospiraceae bacterium]|nr:dipeptide epimerase [Lachnospiraceae bacterium]
MKIKSIQTKRVTIPLRKPFKTALRTVYQVEDVLVCLQTDEGILGYGEAPATAVITGETLESIEAAIHYFIAPTLTGCSLMELDTLFHKMDGCMIHNTSAKAAVDMAIYDAYAKMLGMPLYQLLGGAANEIETDLTISVNDIPQMVSDSLEAIRRGYRILKVKVGKEGLADVKRMKEIRNAVGPDIKIRVDANQGWEPKEAVRIIHALEDANVNAELVEQPVKADDFSGMQFVTSRVNTKILADESVFSAKDAIRIIEGRAADLINIKLMKTGGIHEAVKICDIAQTYGVECMMGCMLEGKVAVSAAAHLAAARHIVTRADLDGPSLCAVDPYKDGPLFEEEIIRLLDAPGIGISALPD